MKVILCNSFDVLKYKTRFRPRIEINFLDPIHSYCTQLGLHPCYDNVKKIVDDFEAIYPYIWYNKALNSVLSIPWYIRLWKPVVFLIGFSVHRSALVTDLKAKGLDVLEYTS
jgi:hypothetical protein